MVLFLLKFLFWSIGTVMSIASLLLFRAAAVLIVLFLHLLKAPGTALNGLLDGLAELIKSAVGYVASLLIDGVCSVFSSGFSVVAGTAAGSVSLTTSAVVELVEKTKDALDDLAEIFPEVFSGASEMIGNLILNVWEHYKDAVGYVMDHA